jgi:hypothetical protein
MKEFQNLKKFARPIDKPIRGAIFIKKERKSMVLRKIWLGRIGMILCFLLVIQTAGCGTLMYPERRGQNQGQIDPGVAVLDALGLLFFIVPGVVAFAVDFTTGAIYLPRGQKPKTLSIEKVSMIQLDPAELQEEAILKIVEKNTGCGQIRSLQGAKIMALNGAGEIAQKFEEAARTGYRLN